MRREEGSHVWEYGGQKIELSGNEYTDIQGDKVEW